MQFPAPPVKPEVFQAMQNVDVKALSDFTEKDLRPVLSCMVRMALCAPVDSSRLWAKSRREVLKILSGFEVVNSLVALLSIDFHDLEQDVRKEQQLRIKLGGTHSESVLISQLEHGPVLEFERSDPARRICLVLSEIFFILAQIKDSKEFYNKISELFECDVYLEEVSDVLCIAQAELPFLLPIVDLAEALLSLKNGSWLLCRLVANAPDSFREVCAHLVTKGEKQDEETIGGQRRMEMLQMLCAMNPSEALNIRALCIQHCTMPGLAVSITLHMYSKQAAGPGSDLMAFTTGLLLGTDQNVRTWFSQFVKTGQKKKRDTCTLHALRQKLLVRLVDLLPEPGERISEDRVIEASAFVRLYCALKGMAALKFNEEEMKLLIRLVTSHPPPTMAGARFVCLALCMLIACPYLLLTADEEKQVIDFIKWLMTAGDSFEKEAGSSTSFGEMLFLIAIHFHSNQMHAIADLVCSTLGMKSAVKANALTRLRQIFTQEIFTEQVITTHAVKVPVTYQLNANMTGYLPVHSIYQLLKSRSFAKHKVPIKDWIYKQICHSSTPLHPRLPLLIEVYVNSIILKGTRTDFLNEAITDQEVLDIYKQSVFAIHSKEAEADSVSDRERSENKPCLTPQLLMLYYLLLYEDCLLSNMKSIVSFNRKVKSYSEYVLEQIPINFLIQEAQKEQQLYAGLFSPLLRLLVTHYPHLCVVEDWLAETSNPTVLHSTLLVNHHKQCTPEVFQKAMKDFSEGQNCHVELLHLLNTMLHMKVRDLLSYADVIVSALLHLLRHGIPRKVPDLVKKIWFRIHGLMPRRIRLMTVNALRTMPGSMKMLPLTENDIIIDPLIVLQGDERVFRCPPILEIVLRVLSAYIHACRVYLSNHIQANPVLEGTNPSMSELERKELKNALSAAQESAVVQILLECCLRQQNELSKPGLLTDLREVQCLICSFLHQMFISDPNLAKLVHFQGYPSELLLLTVTGIPSMHICLDFIPELLSQPQMEKQMFAIELTSHLCCQYALPKTLNIARLVLNVMFTMLGVLSNEERVKFFIKTVPSLVRICQAFPPLCDDVTSLLTQVGRVCLSHLSTTSNFVHSNFPNETDVIEAIIEPTKKRMRVETYMVGSTTSRYMMLYNIVQTTFSAIVQKATVTRNMY